LLIFGISVALETILILEVGKVYGPYLPPVYSALAVCLITNIFIIRNATGLLQAAELRREAERDSERRKHEIEEQIQRLQRDFQADAKTVFDSLARREF
jgi:hypothetical protein